MVTNFPNFSGFYRWFFNKGKTLESTYGYKCVYMVYLSKRQKLKLIFVNKLIIFKMAATNVIAVTSNYAIKKMNDFDIFIVLYIIYIFLNFKKICLYTFYIHFCWHTYILEKECNFWFYFVKANFPDSIKSVFFYFNDFKIFWSRIKI